MAHIQTGRPTAELQQRVFGPFHALTDRLHGPGGFYNAGNLLGLSMALARQFASASTSAAGSLTGQLYGYLAGSPQAVALTVGTAIFLVSGETYHRAWGRRAVPRARLNRIADVLSAAGATALTVSLIFTGQTLLALASGLLIVGGKLGSAVTCDDRSRMPGWRPNWSDPFRTAVLVGRGPGLIAAALDLGRHLLDQPAGSGLWPLLSSATLVVCYALWVRADLMLLGSAAPDSVRIAGRTP